MGHHTATMAGDTTRQEQFRALMERHRGIVFKVTNTYSFHAEDRADLAWFEGLGYPVAHLEVAGGAQVAPQAPSPR